MQTKLLVAVVAILLSVAVLSAAIGAFNVGPSVVDGAVSTIKAVDYYASVCQDKACVQP